MPRWVAATMAAQVAATPAGVKLNRLATGTNVGVTAGVGARASRSKVTAGWVVGGRVAPASDMVVTWRPQSL